MLLRNQLIWIQRSIEKSPKFGENYRKVTENIEQISDLNTVPRDKNENITIKGNKLWYRLLANVKGIYKFFLTFSLIGT